jgi:hypothetical protein
VPLRLERVHSLSTASINDRATLLARTVARNPEAGPIHLIGHSSGGLDARLALSPGNRLPLHPSELEWRSRVRTVVGLNTPHFGTPLAAYFSTVSGTRLLYAVSLLTATTLSLGHLPLSALEGVISAVKAVDDSLGVEIRLVDELVSQTLRVVGEQGRTEIRDFMRELERDQAGIIQLMPEVSELFNAAVLDAPGVRYGSVATAAPPPRARRVFRAVRSPLAALQLAAYTTLYGVASRASPRYPYALPTAEQRRKLSLSFEHPVTQEHVDGVVPTLSMLWGELVWCGAADHLDVVGHFRDDGRPRHHIDWLESGAHFGRSAFESMTAAVTRFLLGRG